MTDATISIARVRLARDQRRVLALPLLLFLVAGATVAGALLLGGGGGIGLAVVAALLAVSALVLVLLPLSVRLDVEVGGVRIRWLAGSRRYQLVRGPVTRVSLSGSSAASVRSRHPILGWSNGPALLRGEEEVTLLRLARTPTLILIPTDRGRLAIAAAAEAELLEALSAAARVQQRLDAVGGQLGVAFPGGLQAPERAVARPPEPAPEPEPEHLMTGIERARLEARLAAAREAALLAAEAERRAALESVPAEGAVPVAAAPFLGKPEEEEEEEAPLTAPSLARVRLAATWTRPAWATDARLRVLVSMAWAGVPLLASLAAWAAASGAVDPSADRDVRLALTLSGPAGGLAILIARTWWPRLTGLVAVSAIFALVLLVRALTP